MYSTDWTGADPRERTQTEPHRETYNPNSHADSETHNAAAEIANRFRDFSMQQQQQQQQPEYTRVSPYHLTDDDMMRPESPTVSDSRPPSQYYAYNPYHNSRFAHNRGSLSSSTASTTGLVSSRTSVLGGMHSGTRGAPSRRESVFSTGSDTSARSPPRPFTHSFGAIDDNLPTTLSPEPVYAQPRTPETPRPSSSASQRPPPSASPSASPSATPQTSPPDSAYISGTPDMPLSPKTRAPIYGIPPAAVPRHSASSPSLPVDRSGGRDDTGDGTRGAGHYPYPFEPGPQPPRSVPPAQPYHPPDIAPRAGRGSSARSASPRPSPIHYIAIGLDFGTTYSGVSWAYSGNPSNIHDVQQYPSAAGNNKSRDEAQVPTLYDLKTGNWGYLIKGDEDPVRWFKLLLLNDDDVREDIRDSEYLRATREKAKLFGDDGPVQLVADFLRQLWQVALQEIALEVKKDSLDSLPLKVALTVPAIWPGYAKESMKRAARIAGILDMRDAGETELILVQEPEAAALATLMERREYPDMAEGETFMVVDCGGGTVDIISYKVLSIRPFRVREVVGGTGKLCGAFMIDDKFVDYMLHKTGFKFDNCDRDEWRQFVYSQWEHALKRSFAFGPSQPAEVHLTPPYQAIPALMRMAPSRMASKKVVLSRDVIGGFFEETYKGIFGLVRAQYSAILRAECGRPPKNIVLVGGLGSSRYLSARLQQAFPNIVQPQRAWSAVARGAVVAILRSYYAPEDVARHPDSDHVRLLHDAFSTLPEVSSRIARLSYGVMTGIPIYEASPPVDPAVDRTYGRAGSDEQRVWRMKWFVTKGEKLDNRDPVSYKFYEYVNDPQTTSTTFQIFTSAADAPPARRDPSCSLLCTLRCQYDTPFDSLRIINARRGLRVVDNMRLTMRFGAEPEWRLQVGQRDVKEKVNVEFQMG